MARKLPKLETPIEAEERQLKTMTFSDRWEEELKQKLFEEENNTTHQEDIEEILNANLNVHKKRPGEEWDVPLEEEIKYFDPELSYEFTGYRPITLEQGLDFDPAPFKELADIYSRTGKYTEYPKNSKPYNDFWDDVYDKCNNGITIGKYRLTGDNWFFLNFYRMDVADENTVSGGGRTEQFPDFIAKQYEWFHYVEMAEKLRKDVGVLKSRGVGWSEMTASMLVRPYSTKRGYNVMLTAFDDIKLSGTKQKCWFQLNWLNANTQGGLRHLRQKFDNDDMKKASIVTSDGTETGWKSMITCVIANTADKIRGPRLDRLVYEEAGSNKILIPSWIKGRSLVEVGGVKLGTRIFLGTGGDDIAIDGISKMFGNPDAYNILPYKNYDTEDGRPELTAFFLPAHKFSRLSKYVDKRGVTNYPEFKKVYEEQRSKLTDQDYLDECAEHCFIPREALSKHGESLFDAVALAERMVQIKVQGLYTKPKRMQLLWDKSKGDKLDTVIARESSTSQLLVVEPPLIDETGKPYKNLYVAGIDAIDQGRKDSATDRDVSDFCIVIKKRIFGMNDPKYVAIYKCRPDDIRQAYDISMKLLVWYNCKALLEYTKISIQTYFKEKGKSNLFMSRPKFAVTGPRRPNQQLIGLPATEAVIQHGLELVQNFVNDYWHTIDYEIMIDQLLNYTYENKRKFDIVAALEMAEIADEDLSGVTPTVVNSIKSQWRDIGYYIDENGYKRKGIIPNDYNRTRY